MPDFSAPAALWPTIFTVLLALADCFLGFKLSKFWISLAGFVLGAALGGWLAALLSIEGWLLLLPILLLGVVGALLAYRVYRGGVFLLCFLTAFFGIYSLISIPWAGALAGCTAGLLAGGLSLKLLRPALILSTGIGGGLCAGAGLLPLLGLKNPLWGLLAGIALAISGVAVQFHTTSEEEG
ncbi:MULTISPECIES: hypothetical protein [Eubacteriales]|uniref:DUF4203 domain-containing protein n=1 Tax=Bittarella massiliensis (ex Durand et al. 2017) TaxID=1720313 RepID=A0AAQ1MED2_9FIRM|nr:MULTISPECIES: hypothetical protein [Eubacteriales]ERI98562.1 hypothetical protein HMPREF0262_02724 [Clostridium sp. ATCC 29733]SHG30655.1 hypothetical protein SAMN05444424_2052 [Bittarella massiliensis (ex Durand et al. 2017)]